MNSDIILQLVVAFCFIAYVGSENLNYVLYTAEDFKLDQYHSHEEINIYLKLLADTHSDRCELFSVGYSFEGRQILGLRIGDLSKSTEKRAIWIDAGGDPRTWINPATAIFIASQLVLKTHDFIINYMVEKMDWFIVPITNPDGYEYTRITDRKWTKTRSIPAECNKFVASGSCKCRDTAQGANYNNNWGFHWGGAGAATNPCELNFRGDYAFSESESKAVSKKLMQLAKQSRLHAFISLADYGQRIWYPYGYKRKTYPKALNQIRSIAQIMSENAQRVHGVRYKAESMCDYHTFPVSGSPADWVSGVLNVTYVYTIASRPISSAGYTAFDQDRSKIIPNAEEIFEAIKIIYYVSE